MSGVEHVVNMALTAASFGAWLPFYGLWWLAVRDRHKWVYGAGTGPRRLSRLDIAVITIAVTLTVTILTVTIAWIVASKPPR